MHTNEEGSEDTENGVEILNDDEIKCANTVLDHLRFFYSVIW